MADASGEFLRYTGFVLDADNAHEVILMRILLADGQAKVRFALHVLLERQPGLEVVGEAANAGELLDLTRTTCPGLILLSCELPGIVMDKLLPALRQTCPDLMVVALSGRLGARQAALDVGVDAFVSKGDPPERLLTTIADCCRAKCERRHAKSPTLVSREPKGGGA